MSDATAYETMPYKFVGEISLQVDMFRPEKMSAGDARKPAILLFHGGGWGGGQRNQFHPFAERFAAYGAIALTFSYRLVKGSADPPFKAMADVRDAVKWILERAEALGIDNQKLVLAGGSAGGHLVLTTFFDDEENDAMSDSAGMPAAILLFNPVVDLVNGWAAGRERMEEAGLDPRRYSPAHHLTPGLPPTLMFHGDADRTVPIESVRAYRRESLALGNVCELVEYPGRPHGFFNRSKSPADFDDVCDRAIAWLTALRVLPTQVTPTTR